MADQASQLDGLPPLHPALTRKLMPFVGTLSAKELGFEEHNSDTLTSQVFSNSPNPRTTAWAANHLRATRLAMSEHGIGSFNSRSAFREALNTRELAQVELKDLPHSNDSPHTEAEIVTSFHSHVSLVSKVLYNSDALPWFREGWSAPPVKKGGEVQQVKLEFAVQLAQEPRVTTEDGDIRSDSILALSISLAQEYKSGVTTRSVRGNTGRVKRVNAKGGHVFLDLEDVWEWEREEDPNPDDKVVLDIMPLKALGVIELKRRGYLAPLKECVTRIAKKSETLAQKNRPNGPTGSSRAMSALHQALRYGIEYGSRYTILHDYESGILLEIPDSLRKSVVEAAALPIQGFHQLEWVLLDEANTREMVAYAIYLSLVETEKRLNEVDEEIKAGRKLAHSQVPSI